MNKERVNPKVYPKKKSEMTVSIHRSRGRSRQRIVIPTFPNYLTDVSLNALPKNCAIAGEITKTVCPRRIRRGLQRACRVDIPITQLGNIAKHIDILSPLGITIVATEIDAKVATAAFALQHHRAVGGDARAADVKGLAASCPINTMGISRASMVPAADS